MQQMGPFGGAASVSGRTARPALPPRLGRLPRRAAGIFLRLSRGGLVALGVAVFVGGALAPRRRWYWPSVAMGGLFYYGLIATDDARERVTRSRAGPLWLLRARGRHCSEDTSMERARDPGRAGGLTRAAA